MLFFVTLSNNHKPANISNYPLVTMPIFFTAEEIRTAIDEYKALCKSKGYGFFNYELKGGGNGVYKLFEGDRKIKLNKSEQATILDLYRIIHILYMRELGVIELRPKHDGLLQLIDEFKKKDIYNDYLTENETLEDYFKPLIHANEFINPKNAELCIIIICAIIKVYDEIALLYKKI